MVTVPWNYTKYCTSCTRHLHPSASYVATLGCKQLEHAHAEAAHWEKMEGTRCLSRLVATLSCFSPLVDYNTQAGSLTYT